MALYYEFYGLPGAGKSTLIEQLVLKLRNEGYKVAGSWGEIYYRNYNKHSRYWTIIEMLFHFKAYMLFYRCWQLSRKSKMPSFHYFKRLIVFIHQLIKTVKEDNFDIIVVDEGIIQSTSSLFFLENFVGLDLLEKNVNDFNKNFKIQPVYCAIDVEESMKRMKERPYGQFRRYSYSAGLSLKKAMEQKEYNLRLISSVFPTSIMMDMRESVEENCELLYLTIKKELSSVKKRD